LFRIDASHALNGPLNIGTVFATLQSRNPFRARDEAKMTAHDAVSQTSRSQAVPAQAMFDMGFLTLVAASRAGIDGYSARRRATPEFASAVYDAMDQFSAQAWPKATLVRLA
jgi:hypothetical protein